MSKNAQIAFAVLAVLGLGYMALNARVPKITSCLSYHVMEVPSPNSSRFAVVENSSCEHSQQLQTIVYLSNAPGLIGTPSAPVFSAPAAMRDSNTYSPMPLRLTWLGETELQIAYPRGTEPQTHTDAPDGIKVVFKELERGP